MASKMPSRVSAAASGAVCQWQTSSTDRRGSGDRALDGAHRAPAAPATFEKVDETFTRLRRARELIVRTGVSVAHRPRARIVPCGHAPRIARGATPAHVRKSLDEHERSELPKARLARGATPADVR